MRLNKLKLVFASIVATHSNSEFNIFLDIYNKISNLPNSAKLCLWSLSVLLGLYFFFHAYRLNELIISDFGIEQFNSVKILNEKLEKLGMEPIKALDQWTINRNIYILEGLFFTSLPWTFLHLKSFFINIISYFKKIYGTLLLKFNISNNSWNIFHKANVVDNSSYTKNSKYLFYTIVLISLTTITFLFWSSGNSKIDNYCVMNGFGDGSCSFTNVGDSFGSVCGYIIVEQFENEVASSEVFCSGKVQSSSTVKVDFSIPSVRNSCPRGLEDSLCKFTFQEK